jgi:Cd2+/Zn2+-exporting ATPase
MQHSENKMTFQIQSLECACSVSSLEKDIASIEGVRECVFDPATMRLYVTGDVRSDSILERLNELGFSVVNGPVGEVDRSEALARKGLLRFFFEHHGARSALFGVILIVPGLIFSEILEVQTPLVALASLGALIVAGWPVASSAWRSLVVQREINVNVLMTIAAVGAVIIGAYTEAAMVMVLFAIGEVLEQYAAMRARVSIRSLMETVPKLATVMNGKNSSAAKQVPVESLDIGDIILVKPGERISMDGRVIAGASSINQAPITGESRPILKAEGDLVFAGSINGEGSLQVEVTHLAADSTIGRMIQLVESAQAQRAPAQRFVDRFARYYTPAVVVLAFLVAVVPPLFFGQPFFSSPAGASGWFYRGLALLVVACPCALVLSTPVSIISAIVNASRNGALIKGGAHLEALNRIRAIAFDKTGTITEGQPSIVAAVSVDCSTPGDGIADLDELASCEACDDLMALASAVERQSEHPLATAIVRESERRGLESVYPEAEEVVAMRGRGVSGSVNGRQVIVGSHEYFDQSIPHPHEHCEKATTHEQSGYTTLMVSDAGQYNGVIAVTDSVRKSSREAVEELKHLGFDHLVMLSGDQTPVAQPVAEQVGMTEVLAELLPHEKVEAIEEMRGRHGPVAMVGDGINDAPALATADVGIALGGELGGTAQAMEAADITLMSGDLRQLPFIFRLSRAAMRTISTNIVLSLGAKFAFLILVLLGLGTMWMAVLADVGVSLLVTINGLRLLRRPVRETATA